MENITKNPIVEQANKEKWKPIAGYEGYYEVSNFGRVKSLSRIVPRSDSGYLTVGERILKYGKARGYKKIVLTRKGKSITTTVHRLLALMFIPNPKNKAQVNHKDGNKQNNSLDNLEWVSCSENAQHAYDTGLRKAPTHAKDWITHKRAKKILTHLHKGNTIKSTSIKFKISISSVNKIKAGRHRKINKWTKITTSNSGKA